MSSDRNLELFNIKGIMIGDILISPEMLESDAKRWYRRALLPGIGRDNFGLSDEELLRQLCFGYMPFSLTAEESVMLRAEVARFPYSIYGNLAYQSFACRLMPESGHITKCVMHESHSLAINKQIITPEGIIMTLGNDTLNLEVYFSHRDKDSLASLRPCDGYRENIVLDMDHAIG